MELRNDSKVKMTSPTLAPYFAGVTSPNLLSRNFHGSMQDLEYGQQKDWLKERLSRISTINRMLVQ